MTPIFFAVQTGNLELVKFLIEEAHVDYHKK